MFLELLKDIFSRAPGMHLLNVTEVFVIDGTRNLLTKFAINWMKSAKEADLDDLFLGYPIAFGHKYDKG